VPKGEGLQRGGSGEVHVESFSKVSPPRHQKTGCPSGKKNSWVHAEDKTLAAHERGKVNTRRGRAGRTLRLRALDTPRRDHIKELVELDCRGGEGNVNKRATDC